jgi:hypothetical protein
VTVYAVIDDSLSRHLLGDSIDVFVPREIAELFIAFCGQGSVESIRRWRQALGVAGSANGPP